MASTTGVFEQQAEVLRPQVESELRRYSRFSQGCPERLREAICYSLLAPGKRLRPLLVLSATNACGSDIRRAMPAACAIEMVHAYSLIHDDLPAMDDDDLRRGQPTCHKAFDEATAILAGDALLTRAFEIIVQDMPPELAARSVAVLASAAGAVNMVGGQADDLQAERPGVVEALPPEQRLDWLESIHQRKTGAMLTAALKMGAVAAEASDEQTQRLTTYGACLGLAFQIIDDLLDATGSAGTMGKRAGQDQSRGKLTYPALLGVEASRAKAEQLVDKAIEQLEPFGKRGVHLESLARFVLERKF